MLDSLLKSLRGTSSSSEHMPSITLRLPIRKPHNKINKKKRKKSRKTKTDLDALTYYPAVESSFDPHQETKENNAGMQPLDTLDLKMLSSSNQQLQLSLPPSPQTTVLGSFDMENSLPEFSISPKKHSTSAVNKMSNSSSCGEASSIPLKKRHVLKRFRKIE